MRRLQARDFSRPAGFVTLCRMVTMTIRLTMLFALCTLGLVAAQIPPLPEAPVPDAEHKPRLVVSERTKDLGKIIAGTKVPVEWVLSNQGGADLVIERTIAGCGCTMVHLNKDQRVIRPGDSLILRAEFNSYGRLGKQSKDVTVVSNDPFEPKFRLQFHATVEVLYHMRPPGRLNLRAVRRGQTASETLDITAAVGRGVFELLEVRIRDRENLTYQAEPLTLGEQKGRRLRFTITKNAPLGRLLTDAMVRFRVGDVEQDVNVKIFGEVVADLITRPSMVKPNDRPRRPGTRLSQVNVRSTDRSPFEILRIEHDPLLTVTMEPTERTPPGTSYDIILTLAEDAPPGPFAATLEVHTSALDQPVLRVPVFGVVAAPIEVQPSVVVLRADGSTIGGRRRLRLEAAPTVTLELSEGRSTNPAVVVEVEPANASHRAYVRYVQVVLTGAGAVDRGGGARDDQGRIRALVSLTTNVVGAGTFTIPVLIEPAD